MALQRALTGRTAWGLARVGDRRASLASAKNPTHAHDRSFVRIHKIVSRRKEVLAALDPEACELTCPALISYSGRPTGRSFINSVNLASFLSSANSGSLSASST